MMPFNTKRDAWLEHRLDMIQKAKERIEYMTGLGTGQDMLREAAVDTAIAMGGRFRDNWLRVFSGDQEMTRLLKAAFAREDES